MATGRAEGRDSRLTRGCWLRSPSVAWGTLRGHSCLGILQACTQIIKGTPRQPVIRTQSNGSFQRNRSTSDAGHSHPGPAITQIQPPASVSLPLSCADQTGTAAVPRRYSTCPPRGEPPETRPKLKAQTNKHTHPQNQHHPPNRKHFPPL